mmetsp:Transcript_16754/g.52380  ORF Transcript_16754/g.52380 Transcript_16754/m.52380 type:complete len:359 (-) Transcript_16754:46-1122(-)
MAKSESGSSGKSGGGGKGGKVGGGAGGASRPRSGRGQGSRGAGPLPKFTKLTRTYRKNVRIARAFVAKTAPEVAREINGKGSASYKSSIAMSKRPASAGVVRESRKGNKVEFNDRARASFLRGFSKRKALRRAAAILQDVADERTARLEVRAEQREALAPIRRQADEYVARLFHDLEPAGPPGDDEEEGAEMATGDERAPRWKEEEEEDDDDGVVAGVKKGYGKGGKASTGSAVPRGGQGKVKKARVPMNPQQAVKAQDAKDEKKRDADARAAVAAAQQALLEVQGISRRQRLRQADPMPLDDVLAEVAKESRHGGTVDESKGGVSEEVKAARRAAKVQRRAQRLSRDTTAVTTITRL